jgi:predicted RNase H-like nuclease (RuvC/YqgF family)
VTDIREQAIPNVVQSLQERIARLESENARLRSERVSIATLEREIRNLKLEAERLERELEGRRSEANEADQILGKLLGYPEYPEKGSGHYMTAPHTLLSLCDEVVGRVKQLEGLVKTNQGASTVTTP